MKSSSLSKLNSVAVGLAVNVDRGLELTGTIVRYRNDDLVNRIIIGDTGRRIIDPGRYTRLKSPAENLLQNY